MPEAQLDEHATCAAEFCWLTVAPAADISSDRMYKADLAVLLKNDAETEFAFSLFDLDGDGYVTEPEVHSRIQGMYRCGQTIVPKFRSFVSELVQCPGLFRHDTGGFSSEASVHRMLQICMHVRAMLALNDILFVACCLAL